MSFVARFGIAVNEWECLRPAFLHSHTLTDEQHGLRNILDELHAGHGRCHRQGLRPLTYDIEKVTSILARLP